MIRYISRFCAVVLYTAFASCSSSIDYSWHNTAVTIKTDSTTLLIDFYREDIARVFRCAADSLISKKSLVIDRQDRPYFSIEVKESPGFLSVHSSALEVRYDHSSKELTFYDSLGNVIVQEQGHSFEPYQEYGENAWSFEQHFVFNDKEGIYGLGQFQESTLNLRNQERLLVQSNLEAVNPYLVSSQGFGMLWDNYSKTTFKDTPEKTTLWSEVGDGIDYYIVAGKTMDKAIEGYRYLTGKAPMLPKWAYGYWQSKERYKNQQEVLDIARGYRERNLPLDLVVQDWRYWGNDYAQWSSMVMNKKDYPDPAQMISTLHNELNTKFMIVVWPMLGKNTEIGREMVRNTFTYDDPGGERILYDAFHPEARNLYWKHMEKNLFSIGVDGWWMDGSEPDFWEVSNQYLMEKGSKEAGKNHLGSNARYLNPFSLVHTQGVYNNQRRVSQDKRVCILTRSAFSGQQKYGAITWSGDITGSYETLRTQISAGLNFSMAGIPYWTQDIGGWLVNAVGGLYRKGNKDLAYAELYTRWFQFGVFNPVFRSHGSNTPREIWQFGGPGTPFYQSMAKFSRLRYRLMPYLYATAHQVYANDYTFMRGLAMDFPGDEQVYDINDQFLFGPSILVSPVTHWMYHPEVGTMTASDLYSPTGVPGEVKAEYFKGKNFDEKAFEKTVDKIKFRHALAPFEGMPVDSFSIRYTGQLKTQTAGTYEFVTSSDDGVRLWVNDELIIDDWNSRAELLNTAEIKLEADRLYDFKLEYYDDIYAAALDFGWRVPTPKELDPERFKVDTYLPGGTEWYDFWTNERHQGGQEVTMNCPLDKMPLYIKAGSILPMIPDIQYAEQEYDGPMELRIYAGKDASFTLYDDEGDNYNYEKEQFSTIGIYWDDRQRVLTLKKRAGSFPGMKKTMDFNVVLAEKGNANGMELSTRPFKTVRYLGEEIKIEF